MNPLSCPCGHPLPRLRGRRTGRKGTRVHRKTARPTIRWKAFVLQLPAFVPQVFHWGDGKARGEGDFAPHLVAVRDRFPAHLGLPKGAGGLKSDFKAAGRLLAIRGGPGIDRAQRPGAARSRLHRALCRLPTGTLAGRRREVGGREPSVFDGRAGSPPYEPGCLLSPSLSPASGGEGVRKDRRGGSRDQCANSSGNSLPAVGATRVQSTSRQLPSAGRGLPALPSSLHPMLPAKNSSSFRA